MQTLSVSGYDMAYLEIGTGRPLVCVHGTLGDFRTWSAVLGPLSKNHRVIAVSLRHFFPDHWDGVGNDYLMAQHVADMIGFLERLGDGLDPDLDLTGAEATRLFVELEASNLAGVMAHRQPGAA